MIHPNLTALFFGTLMLALSATSVKAGQIIIRTLPGSVTELPSDPLGPDATKYRFPSIIYQGGELIFPCTLQSGESTMCSRGEGLGNRPDIIPHRYIPKDSVEGSDGLRELDSVDPDDQYYYR